MERSAEASIQGPVLHAGHGTAEYGQGGCTYCVWGAHTVIGEGPRWGYWEEKAMASTTGTKESRCVSVHAGRVAWEGQAEFIFTMGWHVFCGLVWWEI